MIDLSEDSQGSDEKEIQDIIGVLEGPFYKKLNLKSEQIKFIKDFLNAVVIEDDLSLDKRVLAELIIIRQEQQEACPECLGGFKKGECNACHGTKKKNIYK